MDAGCETTSQRHGTNVAGLISGDMANDFGTVGGAQGADFTATFLRYGANFAMSELDDILAYQSNCGVSNNSWGFSGAFSDNFANSNFSASAAALEGAAGDGRGGLGTVFVFSAGNGRVMQNGVNVGDDSGFHSFQNSRFAIAAGAHDVNGAAAFFSSPGANVLLTAPGLSVTTTNGATDGATGYSYVSGTSFAAPMVSATVALMLEQNPALGYRDVQEILALSAKSRVGGAAEANGAANFNGGGMMFDRHGGFGALDAAAAVNLARHWDLQSTAANEQRLDLDFTTVANPDKTFAAFEADLASPDGRGFSIDHVEIEVDLYDRGLKNLAITLVSPDGTTTAIAESMASVGSRTTLKFTFGSVANWGEDPFGTWRVEFAHASAPTTFMMFDLDVRVYGDWDAADDSHFITGSFADLVAADPGRATLDDRDGGVDTLNFIAAKSAAIVDLSGATASSHAGVAITLAGTFENVIGTVRGDRLTGSETENRLVGDDGGDRLVGGGGADTLLGGLGDDTLAGGEGRDTLDGGAGRDALALDGAFGDFTIVQDGADFLVTDAFGATDLVRGVEIFDFGGVVVDVSQQPGVVIDAGPSIVALAGAFEVADTAGPGAVVATVSADDPNLPAGDALAFSLVTAQGAPYEGPFAVVAGPGGSACIVFTGAGAPGRCDFLVQVVDLAGHVATRPVVVDIVDPNDAPTNVTLDRLSVSEAAPGAVIGLLGGADPDGDTLSFMVDDGRFEVVETGAGLALKLRDDVRLDHEVAPTVQITVTATDAGGLAHAQTFVVQVANVDEAPEAQAAQTIKIEQGAAEAALDVAPLVDPEGRPLVYRVTALPAEGVVSLAGEAVALGAALSAADLLALVYAAPEAVSGSFRFGLAASDGVHTTPLTVAIDVVEAASRTYQGDVAANRLDGAAGDDLLVGLGGADTLIGGAGADRLDGGVGDDRYVIEDARDRVTERDGGGLDEVRASVAHTLAGYVEHLTLTGGRHIAGVGNALDNVLAGNGGDNTLNGLVGSDTMAGGSGNDRYFVDAAGDRTIEESGRGVDRVYAEVNHTLAAEIEHLTLVGKAAIKGVGNALDNVITGSEENNNLNGVAGSDVLAGRGGRDNFDFTAPLRTGGIDRIVDFSVLDDTVRLNDAVFLGLNLGALKADAFVIGTRAADASDRIIYDRASGSLLFDRDGTGANHGAVTFATLSTNLALTNADFIVV